MGFTTRLLRPSQCDRPSGFHATGGTMHLIGVRMTGGSAGAIGRRTSENPHLDHDAVDSSSGWLAEL